MAALLFRWEEGERPERGYIFMEVSLRKGDQ